VSELAHTREGAGSQPLALLHGFLGSGRNLATLSRGLAAGAPLAVAAITRVVNDGLERSLEDALERELEELASLLASVDAREGMTAAVEKRAPRFTGS